METETSKHQVTLLGAGIVGLCTALSLQARGFQVRLIDKDKPGQGASYGNAGVISPWSNVPQAMPGVWRNVPRWLLDPLGPISVKVSYLHKLLPWGMKFLAASGADTARSTSDAMHHLIDNNIADYRSLLEGDPQQLLQDSCYIHAYRDAAKASLSTLGVELRQKWGAEVELMDAQALRELEPALSHDYQAALIIKEQARTVAPGQVGEAMAERVLRQGGEITQNHVQHISPHSDGGWHIETSAGTELCQQLVLSAGAWSAELLRPLGIHPPLEAERGYHQTFAEPNVSLNHSVMDTDHLFVASSMAAGVRLAGTAEFAGLHSTPNYTRAQVMSKLGKSMLPDLNTAQATDWTGVRPSMPDSLPCLGEVERLPGLFLAFGHSHYGMSMAPKSGELIARQIAGENLKQTLHPYNYTRFN